MTDKDAPAPDALISRLRKRCHGCYADPSPCVICEAAARIAALVAALAERDKECDALRKAIGNALYSMSGYAPPEFNSASGILMNAIGKLDAAIRESKEKP
jgi:hypothetical protein